MSARFCLALPLVAFAAFACSGEETGPGDTEREATGGAMSTGGTATGSGGTTQDPGTGGSTSGGTSAWPEGATAAVTLSYDDGLDGQLKYALPALDARGLKATFFLSSFQGVDHVWSLPNTTSELNPRHQAWQAVHASGHELGGHTIYHPCDNNNSGYRPEDYDSARMADELDESLARLARLGATAPFTFAYPCYGDMVGIAGGVSYVPLVDERFLAARASTEGVSPPTVDLGKVSQKFGDTEGATGAQLIAYVDEAIAQGGWAVFTFHGIGPEDTSCDINDFNLDACTLNYLTTSDEAHQQLLDYLVAKQAEVWTAPLKEVALHLSSNP